jgi:hypothetical protein
MNLRFERVRGVAAPLRRANVDTDQILPQIRSLGKSRDLDVREARLSDIAPRRRAFPQPSLKSESCRKKTYAIFSRAETRSNSC